MELRVEIYDENDTSYDQSVSVKELDGKTELEPIVDADLKKFEEFYDKRLKNTLSKFERAAIKTYLYWKTHPETD